jgi:hypothetical protein
MLTATVIGSGPYGPLHATVANLPLWDERNKAQSVLLLVSARPHTEKALFDAIKALRSAAAQLVFNRRVHQISIASVCLGV